MPKSTFTLLVLKWHRNHSLLGTGSRVLTATGLVHRNYWLSTPIGPPLTDRQKICHRWLCQRQLSLNQFWCKSTHGRLLDNAWNIIKFFIYTLFWELAYTGQTSRQIFCLMAQTKRNRARMCLLSFIYIAVYLMGHIPSKPRFWGHK